MIEINKSKEIEAPREAVWRVVSDLQNEHKSWPFLRGVKILSTTENSIEREAKIRRGPMGEATSVHTLSLAPAEKSTMLTLTNGPMLGTRKIVLSELSGGGTKVDIAWQFEMKGVPGFALGFVKDNISKVTDEALDRIAAEAAAPSLKSHDS